MALTKIRASSQLQSGSIPESLFDTSFLARMTGIDGEITKFNGGAGDVGSIDNRVNIAVNALVDSSPTALDTLNELAAALGDDANFATTVTNNLAAKADSTELTAEVLARTTQIGTLTSLTTTAQGSIVAAVNEVDASVVTNASALSDEISRAGTAETANTSAITDTNSSIGTLVSLTTAIKTTIVGALNEVDANADAAAAGVVTNASAIASNVTNISTNTSAIAGFTSEVGTLASLTTTIKTDLVVAINEVDANADAAAAGVVTNAGDISTNTGSISTINTNVGTLASLTTTAQGSLVNAINEVDAAATSAATASATNASDIVTANSRITTIENDTTIVYDTDIIKGESVVGTKNDINTTFTIANAAKVGSIELFINGIANFAPTNFTVAADNLTLTLSEAPSSADSVIASYLK